jgi:hypothetical protein
VQVMTKTDLLTKTGKSENIKRWRKVKNVRLGRGRGGEEEETQVNKYVSKVQREWDWEITECMSMSRVCDLTVQKHIDLKAGLLCPHVQSREPWSFTEAPVDPQAYTWNFLRI